MWILSWAVKQLIQDFVCTPVPQIEEGGRPKGFFVCINKEGNKMTQGLIGGATSYEEQSIKDILEDIERWVGYTEEILLELKEGVNNLKKSNFWGQIYFNFQMTLLSSLKCQESNLYDFSIIIEAIQEDRVSEREVRLLRKIGEKAVEFNSEYGKTYKEEQDWQDHRNPDFKVAESLYTGGRDYFVTLQDASNAAARLEDYIRALPGSSNTNITQNVTGEDIVVAGINKGEINYSNITNYESLSKEVIQAIDGINMLEDLGEEVKQHIEILLRDALDAIKNNDIEKQNISKASFKSFMIGLGEKAGKIIDVLASLASIASFFNI